MGNGKREFVQRDQVFQRLIAYCSLSQIGRFMPIPSITNALSCFYPLISHFGNFSTLISRLLFAANAMVKISLIVTLLLIRSLLFKSQVHQLLWRIGLLPVWPFLFLLSFWRCFVHWKGENVQEKDITIVSSLLNLISKGFLVSRTNWFLQRILGLLLGKKTDNLSGALARQARAAEHHG